jgi:hypothetical protein
MSFWWVNQGDSFEEARKLGALWAPLLDKGGHKKPSWETLDQVQPGDVVFHFAKKKVRGISTATSPSRIAEIRIRDRGQWQDLGREIEVEAQDFDFTIDLEEIPIGLRRESGAGVNTPFDTRGKVKQGYLFSVPDEVSRFLLTRLNLISTSSVESITTQVQKTLGTFADGTDKAIIGTFRREQRALRAYLVQNKALLDCGLCGKTLPSSLLVAAHIKPRSVCSEKERIDANVVMLACVLGCDALFEKGLIFVSEAGKIALNPPSEPSESLFAFMKELEGQTSRAFNAQSSKFFKWHRENALQRSTK